MIIDVTYFTGPLFLPQKANTPGATVLEEFIEIHEPQYLKKALGYELYKAFTEGIDGSGDPDERWTALLDGAEFTYKGKLRKWNGFQSDNLISPIANFVFYNYLDHEAQPVTLVGPAVQKVDNNSRVNVVPNMIKAWNDMVVMNDELRRFLSVNSNTYPEWDSDVKHSEIYSFKNSLDL